MAGYNPEMKKLMLDHAFRYVDRVLFEIGETNIRSQTAIRRIGAQLVGKARSTWAGWNHAEDVGIRDPTQITLVIPSIGRVRRRE